MATLSFLSHRVALRVALALLCLANPGVLRAQVMTRAPADQQQLVTVPDLAGSTVEQARRLLAAAGLELGRVAEGTGSGTPGTVIQQQPRAGSAVAAKSDVRLWLAPQTATATRPPPSRPPAVPLVTVPRLAGRTVEDARATLARVNLQVGAVAELAGSGAPGTIVRQSPQPGFPVLEGSAVRVWIVPARIARQPRDTPVAAMVVRVPNVVGRTVEEARETLAAAGLAAGALEEAAGAGTPGTVARQQPAAGSAMLPNSRVRLWLVPVQVATRPDPPPTRPQPQPPVERPPVQDPAPATPPVTTPPAPVPSTPAPAMVDSAAVPDVRRLALAQAQASLTAAGFAVAFDTALADSVGWTVSAQQPSAGARLEAGGVVALLLDPPAAAVAAAPVTPPPPVSGTRQTAEEPVAPAPGGRTLWISLAALLLVAAAAAGAQRMRARARVLPVTGVSARVRMDSPARVFVEGAPFGDARLRFRMNPGRTDTRVSAAGPLFVRKEIAGD